MTPLTIQTIDASGAVLTTISDACRKCAVEYRLYGGTTRATLEFIAEWGEAPVLALGDRFRVLSVGCPVFTGQVSETSPALADAVQSVEAVGWWRRLDELSVVSPLLDRLVFGTADDSDHPTILTATEVVQWLFTNVIAPDSESPVSSSSITAPSAPCKFGNGGFAIYANDKLTKVLEILAAMDNCVTGIDAEGAFYYTPRATAAAASLCSVRVAEALTTDWRAGTDAWGTAGTFTYDRRGPNTLQIASRDANFTQGNRTYTLLNSGLTGRRIGTFYAPNIRSGQGARRLAVGLFQRFSNYALKVEDLETFSGVRRFEPHLGSITVYSEGVEVASDLCGSIEVDWALSALRPRFTLGENKLDPGSGNSINDPFDPGIPASPPDGPAIDTGDGTTDPGTYPEPSGEVDLGDGYGGDGDDLHTNDDRDDWTDPPGVGVPGVDYGTDTANETNGGGGGGIGYKVFPAIITGEGTDPGTVQLDVLLIASDRSETVASSWDNIYAVTTYSVPYTIGEHVTVFFPKGGYTSPVICSAPAATLDTVTESIVTGYLGMVAPS